MKIEAGKFYRTRDGRKVGPMNAIGHPYRWEAKIEGNSKTFTDYGGYLIRTPGHPHDLIAEWQDEPDHAARYQQESLKLQRTTQREMDEPTITLRPPRQAPPLTLPSESPTLSGSDWIPWSGGECPVHPEAYVEVRFANGSGRRYVADSLIWAHDQKSWNITAYRVLWSPSAEPAKRSGEVWVNVYPSRQPSGFVARFEADAVALPDRLACIRVQWQEGQFDE